MQDPKPGPEPDVPQAPESEVPPEVQPAGADPVREHTAGDEPVPSGPDPRLSIEFF